MVFGEKLRSARLALNLSQVELAEKAGITERSIYNYEQTNTVPNKKVLDRLASALQVSVGYLVDEFETDPQKHMADELFIASAKNEFGYKGAREAKEVLERASALFAGGELDESSKELFYQSLQAVYFEAKREAREKFTPRQRASKRTDSTGKSTVGEES